MHKTFYGILISVILIVLGVMVMGVGRLQHGICPSSRLFLSSP